MAKVSKAGKKYRKNTKLVKAKIQKQLTVKRIKKQNHIKEERLARADISDSDDDRNEQEQNFLKIQSKKVEVAPPVVPSQNEKEKVISLEEIKRFLENPDDQEINDEDNEELERFMKEIEEEEEKDENDVIIQSSDEGIKVLSKSIKHSFDEELKDRLNRLNEEGKDEEYLSEEDKGDSSGIQRAIKGEDEEEEEEDANKKPLTKKDIQTIVKNVKQIGTSKDNNTLPLKKLILAYFVAVYQENSKMRKHKIFRSVTYKIPSNEMYLRVIVSALKHAYSCFDTLMKRDKEDYQKNHRLPNMTKSNWLMIEPLVKRMNRVTVDLLNDVSEEDTILFVLKYLQDGIHYFAHFEKLSRQLLKKMLNLMGHPNESIRFRAFLIIREMCISYPYPFIDLCLKGLYFTLVQNSMLYNIRRYNVIEFLKNSLVELYGINYKCSYQHAFTYIRELAITMRRSLEKTKGAYALSINWRFLNCIDAWSRVLCAYNKPLHELIYPLTQIILGLFEVQNNLKFIPTKLFAIKLLNNLSKKTKMFIPVAPHILSVFNHSEANDIPTKYSKRSIDFDFKLKMKDSVLKTRDFQKFLYEEVLFYLLEYLSIHSTSLSFPELAFPVVKYIKFLTKKKCKNIEFIRKAKVFLSKIDQNSLFIAEVRNQKGVTPMKIYKLGDSNTSFISEDTVVPLQKHYEVELKRHRQQEIDRIQSKLDEGIQIEKLEEDDEEDDLEENNAPAQIEESEEDHTEVAQAKEKKGKKKSNKKEKKQNKKKQNEEKVEKNVKKNNKKRKREEPESKEEKKPENETPKKKKKSSKKKKISKSNIPKDNVKPLSLDDL